MISERDFVLNYVSHSGWRDSQDMILSLDDIKKLYKTICENTSDGSETVKEIEAIMEFIGFGGLNDIAQMKVKRDLFELKNKIQTMV